MVLGFGLTVYRVARVSCSETDRTDKKAVGYVLPKYPYSKS